MAVLASSFPPSASTFATKLLPAMSSIAGGVWPIPVHLSWSMPSLILLIGISRAQLIQSMHGKATQSEVRKTPIVSVGLGSRGLIWIAMGAERLKDDGEIRIV
ncbi:hypothetical protein GQ457_01G008450 [Hibiscus cannabinus]